MGVSVKDFALAIIVVGKGWCMHMQWLPAPPPEETWGRLLLARVNYKEGKRVSNALNTPYKMFS